MPQVPSYGGPRIGPAPLPANQVGTSAPREAFGGGEATSRAFGEAGRTADVAGRIFAQQQQDAFGIAEQDVLGKLSQKEAELSGQIRKSQRKEAQGAADNALVDFDKYYQELEKGLGNDKIKRSAKAHFDRHRTNLYSNGQTYAAGQLKVADKEDFTTAMASEADNGLGSVLADPSMARHNQAIEARSALIAGYMSRNDVDPKVIAQAQKDAASEMNLNAIKVMIDNGFDIRAVDFYKANKGGFNANDQGQADRLLELGSTEGEATRQADKIFQEAPSRSEANKMVMAATEGNHKLRKALEEKLDNRYRREEIAKEHDYQKDSEQTFKMVSQMLVGGDSAEGVVGSVKYNKLKPDDQKALNKLYRVVNGLEEPANDWSKVTAFNLMAPAKLAAMTEDQLMKEYRPYMDDTTYKNATETVNKARQGGGEDVFSDKENIFRAMQETKAAGITWQDDMESVKKSPVKSEMYGKFSTAVQRRYIQESEAKKGKLTPDEKQKILDGMLLRVRVNGVDEIVGGGFALGHFNPLKTGRTLYGEKRIFEFGPQDRVPVGDIPTEDWDVILNQIQAAEAKNNFKFKDPQRVGEMLRAAYLAGNKAEWSRLLRERD
jgi:hypothetical protein